MGYRHQLISDTMVPSKDSLPKWFVEKYKNTIDFNRDYWASYTEYKQYGEWRELHDDVQKVIQETDCDDIKLVYFADEGDKNQPDISHVYITENEIVERRPEQWEIYEVG